jgi:thioredoxin-like negative regulator of GroEL
MRHRTVASFLAGCVVLTVVPALVHGGETATDAFASGRALLTHAKFDEALQAFRTAATTDADNAEYQQTYTMLRQIIRLRGQIETERAPDRWLSMARALRTFYHDYRIYSESLLLDRRIHERRLAPDSAELLAETLLALGRDSEAAELLSGLPKDATTPRTHVLYALALARQGHLDDAKAVARKVTVDKDAHPRFLYELACLHALTGDTRESLSALTRSFERTPPSRLDSFKTEVAGCSDLTGLVGTTGFASVLETQSKVKESSCSKAPSCGQCPRRAKCGTKTGAKQTTEP